MPHDILDAVYGSLIAGAIGFDGNFIAAGLISLAFLVWIVFALGRVWKYDPLSPPSDIYIRTEDQTHA